MSAQPSPPAGRLAMTCLPLPDADAFNGALLRGPQANILVYRTGASCAFVSVDDNWKAISGTHVPLGLWRNEDPRLVAKGNRIFLSTSYTGRGIRRERVELRELALGGPALLDVKLVGKFRTILGDPRYRPTREKNWAPFFHRRKLYYVHRLRPHRILAVHQRRGAVKLVHETDWELPAWWSETWGLDLRLNAPPFLLSNGTYLSTFHTWHQRGYRTWFYSFEARPPFQVLSLSGEPVILPQDAYGRNPRNRRHNCVFINGLQVDLQADKITLSGGNNDCSVVLISFALSSILQSMRPVR